jgi:hypothetical protein
MLAMALFFAASAVPACGPEYGQDTANVTANVTDCEGAYTDVYGYCRAPNGRFTFRACCEAPACELDAETVLEQQDIDEIQALFPEGEV